MKRIADLRRAAPGWLFTGLAVACGVVLFVLTALRPLLRPLLTAAALATVLHPLVTVLAARRVPRSAGALLGCLLVIGPLVVSVIVFVAGLSEQPTT